MVAKQVADLITFCRSLLVAIFPWIALAQGERSLPWAAVLLAADWTGDSIDGTLARRSRVQYRTWIGDHDLEVDIAVSLGLLLYMLITGYLKPIVGILYLLFWLVFFLRNGIPRSLGMLFQAPIYGWFIYVALVNYLTAGLGLVAWVIAALIVTWPKFPQEVVPGFLSGMGHFLSQDKIPDE